MLEEILAEGDRALLFTQFAEMGKILAGYLPQALGTATQFLHGGTPAKTRDQMVKRFQEDEHAPPIFILSLKAGGTGLNLTRANHVFHFDRWWNPAVEDQATDRAFRIGQKRNVQVHKFVTTGTLEEMIDDMIESKKDLAQIVVGSGESWLTELSTSELRELVRLRSRLIWHAEKATTAITPISSPPNRSPLKMASRRAASAGSFAKNWWAKRWIEALERLVDSGRLSRGRSYARKGQVLSIEETKTGIAARVQGSRRTPYKITIQMVCAYRRPMGKGNGRFGGAGHFYRPTAGRRDAAGHRASLPDRRGEPVPSQARRSDHRLFLPRLG